MSESQPFPQPEGERAAGSRRTPWIVAAVAVVILSVLLWDSRETASTVGVEETTGADGTAGRTVTIDPPLGPEVRREVIVLATLGGLPSVPKGAIVEAAGLVVDIVDRPGVPFRVTLADRTGIAEVVSFAASDELKARIRGAECLRLDAQVDTYRGDFQLEPVAFSLIRTGTAAELGFDPGLRPAPVERYSDLAEGKVVAFDARVLSVLPTRGGGSMHGELEFPAGDRIRYLWSDPPDGLGAAELVTAVARVGSYENRLQVRPFTGSARLATATAGPTPAGPAAPLGIVEAMAAAEGAIVRTRGLVADVIESERIPFMVLLADARGSVKLVISGAPEPLRTRLREAMSEGGAVALEARINTYRNEKQLQPTDAEALEFLPAGAVEPPAPIARTSDLEVGQVVRFEGLIGDTRRNRAGGLNGSVSLGSGRSMDFIWWSPPGWAERGVRIGGFARVGEFREAMQLEMTGSVRRLEP